jgi:hypothetical protein
MPFIRQGHKEKPLIYGSFQDRQYSIWRNLEDIYRVDHESEVLIMPLFWGLPPRDYSKYNNQGTNYGATRKNGSLNFDGNDYIGHGNILDIGLSDRTVSVWVKTSQTDLADGLVGKLKSQQIAGRYGIFIYNNKARTIFSHAADGILIDSTSNINDDVWHLIVATYDRDGLMSIYFDGDYENSISISAYSAIDMQPALNFDLGIYRDSSNNPDYHFDGFINETRISNTIRTADQIALFHDRPWDLYRPVSRPIYSLPTLPAVIMNQLQGKNLGADLFNGSFL